MSSNVDRVLDEGKDKSYSDRRDAVVEARLGLSLRKQSKSFVWGQECE